MILIERTRLISFLRFKKELILLCLVLLLFSLQSCSSNSNVADCKSFEKNDSLIVEYGIEILNKHYGSIYVKRFQPYKVNSNDADFWIVEGSIKSDKGGTPYVKINKMDCSLVEVLHGK